MSRLGERQISFSLYFQRLYVWASCSNLKGFLHFGSKRILLDFRNMISIAEFFWPNRVCIIVQLICLVFPKRKAICCKLDAADISVQKC